MNKTNYMFCCLIIIGFFTISNTLTLKKQLHTSIQHHNLQMNLRHFFHHALSSSDHQTQIPDSIIKGLRSYVADDTEIANSIHSQKPLSKKSAEKVKNFFLNNQQFSDFTFKTLMAGSKDSKCLNDLKDDNRKKFLKIIMDELDFSIIFLSEKPNQQFSQKQINQIVRKLKQDKDLSPFLIKCFGQPKV